MAEKNNLSTITDLKETTLLLDEDVLLVSRKSGNQYVSEKAKISSLPFASKDKYASKSQAGIMSVGAGLAVNPSGRVDADYSNMPIATTETAGAIKVGANLQIADDGTLSARNSYELPIATANKLGGIKVGANLQIADDGTLSARNSYELPIATANKLGGIKVGDGLNSNEDGTVYVSGVTKIIAGDNVVVSPAEGTGQVRISATSGGGGESVLMPAVVGSIIPYMGTDLPEGYLMCDGSEVSKATYSELYAVIGDRFGTATDASKFKLPKIDDARYLQGNATPGTNVNAGLPKPAVQYQTHSHSIRSFDGANQNQAAMPATNSPVDATVKDDGIYGNSDTVTPLSITVRYLICYKKVIGKVDATCVIPNYLDTLPISWKGNIPDDTTKMFEVTENCYLHAYVFGKGATTDIAKITINEKIVSMTPGYTEFFGFVKKGDIIVLSWHDDDGSLGVEGSAQFYNINAYPAKISELFMGAPDYSAEWKSLVDISGGAIEPAGSYTANVDGFVKVYAGNSNYDTPTQAWTLKINNKTIFTNYCQNDDVPESHLIAPVSSGDVLTWSAITSSSGGVRIDFIPRKKIQIDVSDVVAAGSGGVIDGELWKKADGSDQTETVIIDNNLKEIYTVVNDCLLYVECKPIGSNQTFTTRFYINGKRLSLFDQSDYSGDRGAWSFNVPVKKGSKISATYGDVTDPHMTEHVILFEYKLHSLAPQIAMPDYSHRKEVLSCAKNETKSWTATDSGWVKIQTGPDGGNDGWLAVGEDRIWTSYGYTNNTDKQPCIIPVSSGDILSCHDAILSFYPCKSVQQSHPTDCVSYVVETGRFSSVDGTTRATASENDSWYRLYSDGWCEMGGIKSNDDWSEGPKKIYVAKHFTQVCSASYNLKAVDTPDIAKDGAIHHVNYDTDSTGHYLKAFFSVRGEASIEGLNGITWRAEGFVA